MFEVLLMSACASSVALFPSPSVSVVRGRRTVPPSMSMSSVGVLYVTSVMPMVVEKSLTDSVPFIFGMPLLPRSSR